VKFDRLTLTVTVSSGGIDLWGSYRSNSGFSREDITDNEPTYQDAIDPVVKDF
jgi:hypothetical protein